MSEINVRAESFPIRCEICHQSDCFDAESNYCSRCAGIQLKQDEPKERLNYKTIRTISIFIASVVSIIISAIIGAFVTYFIFGIIYIAATGGRSAANGEECARGMALGLLSILGGFIIGGIAGGYGICKVFKSKTKFSKVTV